MLDYNKKLSVIMKGRWNRDYICSNCGCKIYPMDIDFGDFNYCPNCGSYMKEDKE